MIGMKKKFSVAYSIQSSPILITLASINFHNTKLYFKVSLKGPYIFIQNIYIWGLEELRYLRTVGQAI